MPKRSYVKGVKSLSVQDFLRRFPTDEACLKHLMDLRFGPDFPCPKCGEIGKFRKLAKHPAYTCNCGHHVHPMEGTFFKDTHVPLGKWFYAIYLFTTTRHGVPAKELERQLGVSYPTAFRMAQLIRVHMAKVDGDPPLSGHVEVDESYVGGRAHGKPGRGAAHKTVVFGMLERGGDVMTRVVPNARERTLEPLIVRNIEKGSTISSDEFGVYHRLGRIGFTHGTCNHGSGQYVSGIYHTNSLEGFWSMLKRSIRGTHVHVSAKHLAKYLGEFEYRYNLRRDPKLMFWRLVESF